MLLNSLRFPTVNTEHIASIGIYINAVALRIVFCKHSFHSILSPYRPINHSLQKLEAFQSVLHVVFILCYTDIVNIGLHFFHKDVRLYAASCSEV